MKRIVSLKAFAILLIAGLAGCQSTSTTSTTTSRTSDASGGGQSRCEKLKQESFYNTATGRSVANATCAGIFTKMSYKDSNTWVHRENTRQRGCLQQTGKLCED
ncbi:hypothetical protein [Roseibium sediminicola]|uniref:Lipoprotein n=1 Tax=Roseibium sediminicola TaxID=2933272 RepID=A0ABT0GQN2_9HYPH|nr:hypothetical protein [Roseibium sp. CAU 1639]MCK7611606.1 hypothetical protein [Roseibium sp. CAU 1639]